MGRRSSKIMIQGSVAKIELTKGFWATIDVDDLHLVEGKVWTATCNRHTTYAYRNERDGSGKVNSVLMHRLIAGAGPDNIVDHRDRNGLNNRRSNLRLCDYSENICNSKLRADSTSGYKGVSWHGARGRYRANIKIRGKNTFLGYFDDPEDAHDAYVRASKRLHKEFANSGN